MSDVTPAGDDVLYVGTDKGLFRVSALDGAASVLEGPYLAGHRVLHVIDTPGRPRELYAAIDHPVWGAHVHVSRDGGEHWTSLGAVPHHPAGRH